MDWLFEEGFAVEAAKVDDLEAVGFASASVFMGSFGCVEGFRGDQFAMQGA